MGGTRRNRRARRMLIAALTLTLVTAAIVPVVASADEEAPPGENVWLTERRIANIAHRGGAHEAPEETLYAYKTAEDRGADVLEMDLHITSDGQIVALHDNTVNRTTNGTGCAVDHTLADLKQYDAAYNFVPGSGTSGGAPAESKTMRGIATGEVAPPEGFTANDFTIPTLAEIFEAAPDALMNMEIKDLSGACLAAWNALGPDQPDFHGILADLIDAYDMADQVLVASFSQPLIEAFKAAAPDIDTTFSLAESLDIYNAYVAGEDPPNPNGHKALQVPTSFGPIVITEELVHAAQDSNIAVHFWTINNHAQMNTLLDWGVDGIITDRPSELDQILTDRGEPRPGDDDEPEPPVFPPLPEGTQTPFLCTTEIEGLGQPIVDNQEKRGTPVYPLGTNGQPDRTQDPLGWSEWCQAEARVDYFYRQATGSQNLIALTPGTTEPPANVRQLPTSEFVGASDMEFGAAETVPYVIRYERGTLPQNRFIYTIAMLVPWEEWLAHDANPEAVEQSHDLWNKRLVLSLSGGVAIGHSQGRLATNGDGSHNESLQLGYGVLWTSGNRTNNHYNLLLAGRTATEAKQVFSDLHAEPVYTVGLGGSGGGIQQYSFAQNFPDILDAAIPQYSYPDMATQAIHIGDCELLEHYMDVLDADNERWQDWDNRKILEGLNSIESRTPPTSWMNRMGTTGTSECIEGWRGSTPVAMNPTFGVGDRMDTVIQNHFLGEIFAKISAGDPHPYPDDFPDLGKMMRVHEDPSQWVQWTHFDDVIEAYGVNPLTGHANVPWDNVGVQYGLRAVAQGQITPEEFLDLNSSVGGWKERGEEVPESCWTIRALAGDTAGLLASAIGMCAGENVDPWSSGNQNFSTDPDNPAPRRSADVDGIRNAFESGLVFSGNMPREIPMIDSRHYLEDILDMHNSHQSFAVRDRIVQAKGNHDNHLIWFLDARPARDAAATVELYYEGFRVIDEWVLNIQAHPTGDVSASRPDRAVDKCWETNGTLIAEGDGVWSGAKELVETGAGVWTDSAPTEVDGVPVGACSAHFPLHSTSRIVAGAPIAGDMYKCQTKPVGDAISAGVYGDWTPSAAEQARLEKIFPNGVCDYSKPGVGEPGAHSYAAKFAPERCAALRSIADALEMSVSDVVKMGVEGFGGVMDQGGAYHVEDPLPNKGSCEIVVTWDSAEEAQRVADIAAAWGVDVDTIHLAGGEVVIILIVQAIQAAQKAGVG